MVRSYRMQNGGPESDLPPEIDRRKFIRFGATGLALSVGGAAIPRGTRGDEPSGPPSKNAGREAICHEARPQEAVPQEPPPVGDLIDPVAVPTETWLEPWIWRPEEWPGDALDLNVIELQNPGPAPSPGNPFPSLFSYGGTSPAPTIRARGDTTVGLRLRNMLGLDHQMTPVGPAPDPFDLTPNLRTEACRLVAETDGLDTDEPPLCRPFFRPEETYQVIPARLMAGYALVNHANGQRTTHVTNIHTHGLHVPPNFNPDGSLSDNVLMRVLPRADWAQRQRSNDPSLRRLRDLERVGAAEYQIRLGEARHGAPDGEPRQPHPPGTHWYHPHAHGSTHDQVASGMAGFFIVEGDVDDAISRVLTGATRPDPEEKTGPFDYRERLIFIQRVFIGSVDLDAGPRRRQLRFPPLIAVNGVRPPAVLFMRPGAVERWRVLNGSVDGSGFKRFMVLEGQFVHRRGRLWRVVVEDEPAREGGRGGAGGGGGAGAGGGAGVEEREAPQRRLVPVTRQEMEEAKLPLHLLAFDGITLVTMENGQPRHTIKDLSHQNAGTTHPLARPPAPGENQLAAMLRNIEDCYRDGDSLRRCFNRPNEVYLGNANRADVFFKAPIDAAGKVFTVFAKEVDVHTDNFQQRLQIALARGLDRVRPEDPETLPTGAGQAFNRPPFDVVVGYIHVRGEPVEGGDFDVMSLVDELPEVPPFLHPVEEDEVRVGADEARARGVPPGHLRTRIVSYSGWGGADWPLIHVPEEFAQAHPELERLVWARYDGVRVLLPNYTRSMAINSHFDLAANPEPPPPRKFMPGDPERAKVLLGTAEEWVLYNNSLTVWGHTDTERFPQPGQWGAHYTSYPLTRAAGQARFAQDPEFQITSKGSDHPFHIHINPMWVTRIDVPDENGNLHNILEEPRWMDTVPIPRNGGRVVFRSRFLDFVGTWVHHCHILLHEDNGMMQVVECTDESERADYNPRAAVASHAMDAAEVDQIYPPPSIELMYRQGVGFVDPSPETGQVYPGFPHDPPVLEAE
jgi:FtsP/CotA-like multicopper oxidase with cupredoxin domain